jgi:hypothetical protein
MKKLNFTKASLGQLYEIAVHDHDCRYEYKLAARYEIKRRFAASKAKIKYTEKR